MERAMALGQETEGGLKLRLGFWTRHEQELVISLVHEIIQSAPLFAPRMPGTGKAFSVQMTNCGPLGWVSDEAGYRYQSTHPETGRHWPPIPDIVLDAWRIL